LTQKISRQLIVQDNLLLTVLRRVVESRCVFLDDDSTPSHYFISQAPEIHLYSRCVSRSTTRTQFSTRQREDCLEEIRALGKGVENSGLSVRSHYVFTRVLILWDEDLPAEW
jgi:hypothetical protein